nr:type I restriction-modification system subunit M N-terminal domain-containing protein [Thiolapillus sp.]
MTQQDRIQLGKTLWAIADDLRGSMNADDFRDYTLPAMESEAMAGRPQ